MRGEHDELDAVDKGLQVPFGDGVCRHVLALRWWLMQASICAPMEVPCSTSRLSASVRWPTEWNRYQPVLAVPVAAPHLQLCAGVGSGSVTTKSTTPPINKHRDKVCGQPVGNRKPPECRHVCWSSRVLPRSHRGTRVRPGPGRDSCHSPERPATRRGCIGGERRAPGDIDQGQAQGPARQHGQVAEVLCGISKAAEKGASQHPARPGHLCRSCKAPGPGRGSNGKAQDASRAQQVEDATRHQIG